MARMRGFPWWVVIFLVLLYCLCNLFLFKKVGSEETKTAFKIIQETHKMLNEFENSRLQQAFKGKVVYQDWESVVVDINKLLECDKKINFEDDAQKRLVINRITSIKNYVVDGHIEKMKKITQIRTKLHDLSMELASLFGSFRISPYQLGPIQKTAGRMVKKVHSGFQKFTDLIVKLLTWPIVAFILFACILFSDNANRRLTMMFGPFKSVKLPGAEFVLDKDDAQRLRKSLESTIEATREEVTRAYDNSVYVHQINDTFIRTIKEFVNCSAGNGINLEGFRFTIHVPDILFQDRLYQLLDYHHGSGGKGRTNPTRFGIIGRTWRLRESQLDGSVTTDENELVKEWGMTIEEAEKAGRGRSTFMCLLMKTEEGIPVGIMYSDKEEKDEEINDSGRQKVIISIFDECAKNNNLIGSLSELNKELREQSLLLKYS